MSMKHKTWFSVKCIFRHADRGTGPRQNYEERVVLIRARKLSKAIKIAKREAKQYARAVSHCSLVGVVDSFGLFDKVGHKAEVFAIMRQSDLDPAEYLNHFYPSFSEDCEAEGKTHRFYNQGKGYAACYHCQVVKEGELWKSA